ncbi:hypothetical protein HK097_000612 [Rhizophlyctis rosea]|uniref:AAA+ ATPase domain-containing protein n=1 Tax=Rhizophlyctis rosea TaxID=64517 RepID=A0AAD5SI16_9FUNG|nr:hypothetical protein HK097_000612 [Rhizophlyctis rosea]
MLNRNAKTGHFDEFFHVTLSQPYPVIAYHAHRAIRQITHRYVLQTEDQLFDLPRFAAAGKCTLRPRSDLHAQSRHTWKPKQTGNRHDFRRYEDMFQTGASSLDVGTGNVQESLSEQVLAGWYSGEWDGKQFEAVFAFVIAVQKFCAEMKNVVWVFERGGWQPSAELYQDIKGWTFDNLILSTDKIQGVKDDLALFFQSEQLYREYGLTWKRGFLLCGPPGNGKTHLLKALINHFTTTHPTISTLYVKSFRTAHQTPDEYAISSVFQRARDRPCLLIFEDLDTLITPQNRAFFLNEMDGFGTNSGVVVLATTNHPDKLDESVRDRPSRFDRRIEFGVPGEEERLEYVKKWNVNAKRKEMVVGDDVLTALCGPLTDGFSFAYMKELMISSSVRVLDVVRTEQKLESGAQRWMDSVVIEQAEMMQQYIRKNKESNDAT